MSGVQTIRRHENKRSLIWKTGSGTYSPGNSSTPPASCFEQVICPVRTYYPFLTRYVFCREFGSSVQSCPLPCHWMVPALFLPFDPKSISLEVSLLVLCVVTEVDVRWWKSISSRKSRSQRDRQFPSVIFNVHIKWVSGQTTPLRIYYSCYPGRLFLLPSIHPGSRSG